MHFGAVSHGKRVKFSSLILFEMRRLKDAYLGLHFEKTFGEHIPVSLRIGYCISFTLVLMSYYNHL